MTPQTVWHPPIRKHERLAAVVGANAVVSESVPPWEIWAGAPARKVGERARP
jgi:hypothetical protein